ncbi:MAG: TrmB family transcriptional regulator [Microcoleus sp. SIO2G3]|nr:TrmB family transcriptional regulator [Microcoleus sp. SIO2G3]
MKIPPKPPHSPLQDSILVLLQEAPRTKQELSEILDRPASRITRALRSLLVHEKIEQQVGQEMRYRFPASNPSETTSSVSKLP